MPELYRGADVFALISRGEGMPNVVLEAQASGLAVLGTRVRGTEELIRHEESGLLVDYGDEAALREALGRLIADRSLRRRLGAGGRRNAEGYSWDSVAEAYEELCQRLIRGGSGSVRPC
jgi:glycosyltransferase involved in cell wall biosynthesis